MKVRAHEVLHRAVEEGIDCGWRHAHKHTDAPGEAATQDTVLQGILNEVREWFEFDEGARE